MTTITFGREAIHKGGYGMGAGLLGRVRSYLARSRAEHQLSQLDDRLLDDIGMKRSEISQAIWGA